MPRPGRPGLPEPRPGQPRDRRRRHVSRSERNRSTCTTGPRPAVRSGPGGPVSRSQLPTCPQDWHTRRCPAPRPSAGVRGRRRGERGTGDGIQLRAPAGMPCRPARSMPVTRRPRRARRNLGRRLLTPSHVRGWRDPSRRGRPPPRSRSGGSSAASPRDPWPFAPAGRTGGTYPGRARSGCRGLDQPVPESWGLRIRVGVEAALLRPARLVPAAAQLVAVGLVHHPVGAVGNATGMSRSAPAREPGHSQVEGPQKKYPGLALPGKRARNRLSAGWACTRVPRIGGRTRDRSWRAGRRPGRGWLRAPPPVGAGGPPEQPARRDTP
jgi:hypothetical protein